MKFLKTIRFDPSDAHVFDNAAAPDEWAVPGGFSFAGLGENELSGKQKQVFSNGFLSIENFGHSTFVSVAEIDQAQRTRLIDNLTTHFVADHGGAFLRAAQQEARSEVDFVLDMCADVAINSIFTLRRFFDEAGEIREEFRIVKAPEAKPHARVWEVVED